MKIALIGANGLLGSSIQKYLIELKVDLLSLSHKDFEITNTENYEILKNNQVDLVINTAAYLGVEPCEDNPIDAFTINTKAVGDLARFCNAQNITLVQISTDGVFDGKNGSYTEESNPKPVNMYGITKYNAEQLVSNLCKKYYIFRIPILFGERKNTGSIFIEKMYNLYLNGHKELKIADDVKSRPSYSVDVSKGIIDIILAKKEYGIYHVFNNGEHASLFDFAVEFFKAKGIKDINIIKAKASDFSINEKGIKPLDTTIETINTNNLQNWKKAIVEYCSKTK